MTDLTILEWSIIGFIIFAKFGIILGVALWSKANDRKKEAFYRADSERIRLQSEKSATSHD